MVAPKLATPLQLGFEASGRGLLAAGWLVASLLGCEGARPSAPSPPDLAAAMNPTASVARGSSSSKVFTTRSVADSPLPSFAELVARTSPSVAQLIITEAIPHENGQGMRRDGVGCAFVFDAASHLLTNYHVIDNAQSIGVVFGEDAPLPATVIGVDPPTDLAVLGVSKSGLPSLPLGDSETLRVGDWVVAIGNPFGLSHTVSAGILSAKGRGPEVLSLGDDTHYFDFLQTDASINPGNSGGPLLDLAGRVVGINTAMRTSANGIGFAIPIAMAKRLLPTLLVEGRIRRSAIGLRVERLEAKERAALGISWLGGAVVRELEPGGPGAVAGILPGDVIVELGGESIRSAEHLRWVASLVGVGRTTQVVVSRTRRHVTLSVTMGELVLPPAPNQRDSRVSPEGR